MLVLYVCSLGMSVIDHKAKFYENVLCAFKRFDNPAHAGVVQAKGLADVFGALAAYGVGWVYTPLA